MRAARRRRAQASVTVPLKHPPAGRAAGDQRHHGRRRRRASRAPHDSLDSLGLGVIAGDRRGVHDLARAVAAADALDRRAAAGPARRHAARAPRATSACACRCSGTDETGAARRRRSTAWSTACASASSCARRSGRSSTRRSPTACSPRARSLAGEEVEVTVLFLDIRGFTAFAERAGAREAVARLNEFYELVVPVVVAHGGHANKFVGDGLLGRVRRARRSCPTTPTAACAAALEIAGEVRGDAGRQRAASASASTPATSSPAPSAAAAASSSR